MTSRIAPAVQTLICFHEADRAYLRLLETHLAPLCRERLLEIWHTDMLSPGDERELHLQDHLGRAQLILLLLSADFNAGWDKGTLSGIRRIGDGSVRIVPLILRPCIWDDLPFFGLQPIPPTGDPLVINGILDEQKLQTATRMIRELSASIRAQVPTEARPTLAYPSRVKGAARRLGGRFQGALKTVNALADALGVAGRPLGNPYVDTSVAQKPVGVEAASAIVRSSWERLPAMVTELEHDLLIAIHTTRPPSEAEWSNYLSLSLRQAHDQTHLRIRCRQLVITDGGAPNIAQRKAATDAFREALGEHGRMPVAVVSSSPLARFATTAITLVNPQIRVFRPEHLDDAFRYLRVIDTAQARRRIERLLARVGVGGGDNEPR